MAKASARKPCWLKTMKKLNENLYLYLLLAVFGVILFTFFTKITPVVPWNGDDWRYLSQYRMPYPGMGEWNPARVLPEVLFPLLGCFSAFFSTYFINGYLQAISVTFLSAFVGMILFFYAVLYDFSKTLFQERSSALFLTILVFILSFFLFKSTPANNFHLFSYSSFTDLVFYFMTGILNISLSIYFINLYTSKNFKINICDYQKGFVLLAIFLCQFSMTFSSLPTACVAFILLAFRYLDCYAKKKNFVSNPCFNDLCLFAILLAFITATLMDANGARYATFGATEFAFSDSLHNFHSLFYKLRLDYKIIFLACNIMFFTLLSYKKYRNTYDGCDREILRITILLYTVHILVGIGYVSIGALSSPSYSAQICCIYPLYAYNVVLLAIQFTYLTHQLRMARVLLPLFIYCLVISTTNSFRPYYVPQKPDQARYVRQWLAAIKQAEENNQPSVTILTPTDKWPHPKEWFGEVLAHTLYAHGYTSKKVKIVTEPIKE